MTDPEPPGGVTFTADKTQGTSDGKKTTVSVAPYNLRNKRSALTRWSNKINTFVSSADDSIESFRQAHRLAEGIDKCWAELLAAMESQMLLLQESDDGKKIEGEYDKQVSYEILMEDSSEAIHQLIDKLTSLHGELPAGSFSQQFAHSNVQPESADIVEEQYYAQEEPQVQAESPDELPLHASSGIQQTVQSVTEPASPSVRFTDPEKKITKFNGEPARYRKWWSIFSIYVDSQPLEATEKLRLLEGALTGKAAKAIAHLDFNENSYGLARDIISRRFGSVDKATSSHVHSIHSACMMKDLDKSDKFIDFVSLLGQHVRTLLTLGGTFDALSLTLTPMILDSLPLEQRKKFKEISRRKSETQISPLESLLTFLEDEAMLLEECTKPTKSSHNKNSHQNEKKGKFQKSDARNQSKSDSHESKSKFSFAAGVSSPDHSCLFCKKEHASSKCSVEMSPEERKKIVESQSACLKCLRRNHEAKKCRAKVGKCTKCSGNHHALICMKSTSDAAASTSAVATSCLESSSNACKSTEAGTFLQTGYVWVKGGRSQKICRILLDPGSQKSFVTKRVTTALGIKPKSSQRLKIFGVTGLASDEDQVNVFEIKLRSRFSNQQIIISCIEVPNVIGSEVPRAVFNGDIQQIADVRMEGFPNEIDLIIGCDYLHLIYDGMYRKFGNLIASPTIFGWFIWGNEGSNQIANSVITTLGVCQSMAKRPEPKEVKSKRSRENLAFLWDTEFLGIQEPDSEEDKNSDREIENFFKSTIRRSSEGRYIVSLPFSKEKLPALGSNQKLAFSRLISFLKNSKKKPQFLKAVDEEIAKFIDLGYAEPAEPPKPRQKIHYLPLLAVAKKSLANSNELKVRVVKDGGSRSLDEASLNDVLEAGPSLLPDLVQVLLHFRRRPIAVVADVERAFMQFQINKDHRTYLRFYWPLGISKNPKHRFRSSGRRF